MNDAPLFLTGKFPKKNPKEILQLILCLRSFDIKIPKDILKMIYEMTSDFKVTSYCYVGNVQMNAFQFKHAMDFAVVTMEEDGKITFSGEEFTLLKSRQYTFFVGALPYLDIRMSNKCNFCVDYWTFKDKNSPLRKAMYRLSAVLNSNVDNRTFMYKRGSMCTFDNILMKFSKGVFENMKSDIELCIRNGLVSFEDPLKRIPKYFMDEDNFLGE